MKKQVGFWAQVAITFFIVSGGPYGLETAVGQLGAGPAFLLVILVPVFWALPTTLMVSELSSMMAERGGFYAWVRRGLGRFWGFQEGWWTLCYSCVDLAIYPVLFVTYLSFFWPSLNPASPESSWILRWSICFVFIALSVAMNWLGSAWVGINKIGEIFLVGLPFLVFLIFGFGHGDWHNLAALSADWGMQWPPLEKWAAGLAVVLWNFTGWDNATTYADEVSDGAKTIPKAMMTTLLLVMIFYLVPLLFGFKATVDPKVWGESSGWPEIAKILIGPWLGALTAAAAVISAWALFNSQLLYISRLPAAMADDGLLPAAMAKCNRHGVPVLPLLLAALVAAAFASFSLGKLMIIDILLYSLGLALEFAALIIFRIREPMAERHYRIPLPLLGILLLSACPLIVAGLVAYFSVVGTGGETTQVIIVGLAAASGPVAYWWFNRQSVRQAAE